jgi:hypothetical protein
MRQPIRDEIISAIICMAILYGMIYGAFLTLR